MTVYLDHAASSPMRPEAVVAMLPLLAERFGNPSGSHQVARRARAALEDARDSVAGCLGCLPDEVVFTGGGTEAANLAVAGRLAAAPGRTVCSAVEHHSVLEPSLAAGARLAPVDETGRVDLDALEGMLGDDVALVSVMVANNETGVVQPFEEVAAVVRRGAPRASLHVDAVHAVPWLGLESIAGADLVSVSAHKFGGPPGVGALVVRRGTPLVAAVRGGGHERGRRSGTHNLPGAVAMAVALHVTAEHRPDEVRRVATLRDRLADGVLAAVDGATESGPGRTAAGRPGLVAGTWHVRIPGVDQDELLFLLDEAGVCASAGAACSSGALEASHVLRAMGTSEGEARSGLRLSLGHTTTDADVDTALEVIPAVVAKLRR